MPESNQQSEPVILGTVQDAATKYQKDVADLWVWVTSGLIVRNPDDGGLVRLVADERDDRGRWIVKEVGAAT